MVFTYQIGATMKWLIFITVMCSTLAQASSPLPQLATNRESLTVSGLSSGTYMAFEYQVAHSQSVLGAGIIAGGPYYCAKGQVARALSNYMTPTPEAQSPSPAQQESMISQLAGEGRIDKPEHLRRQRVWMFSGLMYSFSNYSERVLKVEKFVISVD